jgi:hypothetical protein
MSDTGVPPLVHRFGVVAVGLAATATAALGAVFLPFLLVWFCSGSDASSGSDTGVCRGSLEDVVAVAGALAAVGGPFFGLLWSLRVERWKPLWLGCAIGAGVLLVLLLLVLSV